MSRRRGNKGEVAFQLFSFLDVLLCTIGALIIILTITIHRARANARAEVAKQSAPSADEIKKQEEALEEARWRQEQLEKSRAERQEELQASRLALSHLEDHIRRLDAKGKELMELLDKVKAGKEAKDHDLEAAKAELAKIKDELAKKKDDLEKKKKDIANTEKWYALIPYDGPNGTRRMPIYVECVAEGVIIQPEGVLLTTDDFRGEPGPGNPLDTALRVKREYIMKVTGGKAAEPYPLLVVRPSGVMAYGVARAFMKFWEDEFGYELISEEKKLDFGPRDPNLDLVMNREIAKARNRQAVLARNMPRNFRDEAPRSFAPEDNAEIQRRRMAAGSGGLGTGGGKGSGIGTGRGKSGEGGFGSGEGGTGTGPSGSIAGAGSATGPYGSAAPPMGSQGSGGLAGTNSVGVGDPGGSGSGGIGPGGAGAGGSKAGGTADSQGGNAAGARKPGELQLTSPGSPGGTSVAGGTPGGTSETGTTSRPGSEGTNSSQANSGSNSGSASGASSGATGGASGGAIAGGSFGSPAGSQGGQPAPNISINAGAQDQQSPTKSNRTAKGRGGPGDSKKGKNWGLPEAQRHVTGVTRPIRLAVQKDKLILLPERDDRRPQEIGLSPEMTTKEIDILVAGVQRQMRSWGIAVDGGYWKPALSVDVQPGAEDRFAELQSALSGSGIEVQRKLR
jgi:hypothetical protein